MKRKRKLPVRLADVLKRACEDFEKKCGIDHERIWKIEMKKFLKESRADVDAGKTRPALDALDKLAEKHKLARKPT